MSKIKNGGLDQYCVEPFEQQHFVTAGAEGVNVIPLEFSVSKFVEICCTVHCSDSVIIHSLF